MDRLEKLVGKSAWDKKDTRGFRYFCPQCRGEKRIRYNPNPGQIKNYFRVGLTSLVLTFATWPWLSWKGIISFVPLWIIFEIYYRARIRVDTYCQSCGFDPFLYLADQERAKKEMEQFWRKKFAEKGIPYPGDEEAVLEEDFEAEGENSDDEVHENKGQIRA